MARSHVRALGAGGRPFGARARALVRHVALAAAGAGAAGCGAPARAADTVVVASGADLESANPLVTIHPMARQVQRFVLFVTLVRPDSALRPAPYYARRWEWSADRRSITFALEPALAWHDGTPTTARDVAFTLETARHPETGSPRAAELAWLASVTVHDDTLITLHAHRPLAELPAVLGELPIAPVHRLRNVAPGDMRRDRFAFDPLGNGPMRFVERRAGERWVFERWEHFPASMGGAPALRRLVVAVVDEPTTKFAGLVSGDLDVAGIAPAMASLVRGDRALRVIEYPVAFSSVLVFNVPRPPFDDVRVRRAISAAIDRERLVQVALAGFGTPSSDPVPPDHPFAVPSAALPDEDTRHALLDAAGWRRGSDGLRRRGGTPLRFTLLAVGSGDNALEQLVQSDLRRLGVEMEIRQLELGAFLTAARRTPRSFDALVTGIPGDVSLSHLVAMFDGGQRGGALDYTGAHDATTDSLFAAVRTATTEPAARAAWHAVQHHLAERLPVAWLYHARGVQGVARRLHGVTMDLRGELATFAGWRLTTTAGAP